jgi:hypothetical protein
MTYVKTLLDARTYDALSREAGRRGVSMAELLRWCVAEGLLASRQERMAAELAGQQPYNLPPRHAPGDTGAWNVD